MAVRIREGGRIFCAASHPALPGDTYINDHLHYRLSADLGVLVTEPMDADPANPGRGGHGQHGEWWWSDRVPEDVVLAGFYKGGVDGELPA